MADGNKFVGSIRWGWKVDGQNPQLEPAAIEKVADGSASLEFFRAAEAWNKMKVKDLADPNVTHQTIQLPLQQSGYLDWTDSKLEHEGGNIGGSFEEYRDIFDALLRYQSVKSSDDRELRRGSLELIVKRCHLQLERRPTEARNDAVRRLLGDAEHALASLTVD